jgi:hypothetical protein
MMTRWQFLKSMTRLLLLGGLFAGVAHLASRKGTPKNHACVMQNRVCRNCPALQRCSHPDAVAVKETES